MSRSTHTVVAGLGSVVNVQLYGGSGAALTGVFTGAESLSCQVWPGDSQPVTFSPTPSWNTGPLGVVKVTYAAGDTTSVTPGYYEGRIYLADLSAPLAIFDLNLINSPGTSAASLVTMPFVRAALSDVVLSEAQLQFLPTACDIASDAVRQHCNRWFTRRTLTREYVPSYDGRFLLPEMPVNGVSRVATDATAALTITAASTAQLARVQFATTGDRISGLTVTGLTLTRTASGTTTTTTLSFSTYTSVTTLAAAINGTTGWTATVANSLGAWPTSELRGGETAQGAFQDGAALWVYSGDASDYSLDWETGLICLPWQSGYGRDDSPYLWPGMSPTYTTQRQPRRVQVTHDLGFDTVPAKVQGAAALLARHAIQRFSQDETLKEEKGDRYSYVLADLVAGMPPGVRQDLSSYVCRNA